MAKKSSSIAFLLDDRVSHDRVSILVRLLNQLAPHFELELIKSAETTEAQLLQKFTDTQYPLILAPLHRYFPWTRLENLLGVNRTSGPTLAGYFCEPIPSFQLPSPEGHSRRIILDFAHLEGNDLRILVNSLCIDRQRLGLTSLLESNTPLFSENWYENKGTGYLIDAVLGTHEISNGWSLRFPAIRIVLSALWALIFEEGSGRRDAPPPSDSTKRPPRAYFQAGSDSKLLVFRLYYPLAGVGNPKDILKAFWPDSHGSTESAQLLLRFGDFLRVHLIKETSEVELTVGFFPSACSEKAPQKLHTLWIEPLTSKLIEDPPYQLQSPSFPHIKPLRSLQPIGTSPSQDLALLQAAEKIKELRSIIEAKDLKIQELKTGGVGTAQPLPPVDAEGLLDAFQQKYFEAKYQIRKFEQRIQEIEKSGAAPGEMEDLQEKMKVLTQREREWVKRLASTLLAFRNDKPKANE